MDPGGELDADLAQQGGLAATFGAGEQEPVTALQQTGQEPVVLVVAVVGQVLVEFDWLRVHGGHGSAGDVAERFAAGVADLTGGVDVVW